MGVRYMKIEIEIPDLEEIYYGYDDYDNLTGKDIKKIIADIAIEKFIAHMMMVTTVSQEKILRR